MSHLKFMQIIEFCKNPLGNSIELREIRLEEVNIVYLKVSKHNKKNDAWIVLNNNVYNITLYMKYHPGGIETLLEGVGSDATELFSKY